MPAGRPPRLRLFDILDCIRQVEAIVAGRDAEALRADAISYRALERLLEIISEASRHISLDLTSREPAVDWKQIGNFGNVVRHAYHLVDHRIVWNIATYEMPVLKAAAARLYADVKLPADPWPDAEST